MIGIFGGTFDPVHYGHIRPAMSVKQDLGLSQLRFVPNRVPPHRGSPWLSVEQRLSLLRAALSDQPEIVIDTRELEREGASYMVDTLSSLAEEFPSETFVLIIGMDVLSTINRWHQWKSLFDLCHLVVTTRPGFQLRDVATQMDTEDYHFLHDRFTDDPEQLKSQAAGKILLKSVPQLDISATKIRDRLIQGEDISDWIPSQAYRMLREYVDDDR